MIQGEPAPRLAEDTGQRAQEGVAGPGHRSFAPLSSRPATRGSEPGLPLPAAPPDCWGKEHTKQTVPLLHRSLLSKGSLEKVTPEAWKESEGSTSFSMLAVGLYPTRSHWSAAQRVLLRQVRSNGTQIPSPDRYGCFSRRVHGFVLKEKSKPSQLQPNPSTHGALQSPKTRGEFHTTSSHTNGPDRAAGISASLFAGTRGVLPLG